MQAISPVTVEDLLGPAQEVITRLDVWDGAAWVNLSSLDGKCYLGKISVKMGGAGPAPDPVAGTWSASISNENGIFDPFHPTSAYAGFLSVGRKVRILVGARYRGTDYVWQRMIGYIDSSVPDQDGRTIALRGYDFTERLKNLKLTFPGRYWGEEVVFNSVSSTGVTGSEIYAEADAADTLLEADEVGAWSGSLEIYSVADTGGGSNYALSFQRVSGGSTVDYAHNNNVGSVTVGSQYYVSFKSKPLAGTNWTLRIYQTVSGSLKLLGTVNLSDDPTSYTDHSIRITALKTGAFEMRVSQSKGAAGDECRVDQISVKLYEPNWYRYQMPAGCNGPYYVTLDGDQVVRGSRDTDGNFDGYLYDPATKYFYFDDDRVVSDGTANLKVKFYTDQIPENVVADILVQAGYYADRATALATMSYRATGVILGRVWFEEGTTGLAAIKYICERVNYRFWFDAAGSPCFMPAPTATAPVFTFALSAHVKSPGAYQDRSEIQNHIVIEGAETEPFAATDDQRSTRLTGEASDDVSIGSYLKRTKKVENHLFQDQDSIDGMTAILLAAFKDPKYYSSPRTPFIPAPLELGDTIAWPLELEPGSPAGAPVIVNLVGVVRDIEIDGSDFKYMCEIVPAGTEMGEHALLSELHVDTEAADPVLGDLVVASGSDPAPAAAEGTDEHALLSGMHTDTEAAAPLAADVLLASGDPVLWRRLPAGVPGQIFEMGATLPKWGRKITSSDSPPAPEEGSDGDIHLEY